MLVRCSQKLLFSLGSTLNGTDTFATRQGCVAILLGKVNLRNVKKKYALGCGSASFSPSSSDFLSQSRLNKGPHRHRIKQYCLVGDLISLHHKRPSQPCHCNLSQFFCVLYLPEVPSPLQSTA